MYAPGLRACGPWALGMWPLGFGHTHQANDEWPCYKYYVSLCSHSNNISSFNPTSNCHTCSQGYKYKLLMPYRQGVVGSKVCPPIMFITFPGYTSNVSLFSGIYFSCIPAFPFDLSTQSDTSKGRS